MLMKSAKVVDYDFIPENKDLLKNDGFCVIDNFVGTYGKRIKKITQDYFIDLCYQVRGEKSPNETKQISRLDDGINDDEELTYFTIQKYMNKHFISLKDKSDNNKILV